MHIYYTASVNGILNHSYSTPAETEGSCRVASHQDELFCLFIASGAHDAIPCFIKKSASGTWTQPQPIHEGAAVSSVPGVVCFNGGLYAVMARDSQSALVAKYNPVSDGFEVRALPISIVQTPALSVLNDRLFLFYKVAQDNTVRVRSTTNLIDWTPEKTVLRDASQQLVSDLSPVACTYQGLVHLLCRDVQGFHLCKCDAEENWTRAQLIVPYSHSNSPAMVVHNGLLNIIFSRRSNDTGNDLYRYCYDGNSLSLPVCSTHLSASRSVGAGVLGDALYVMYRGV